MLGRHEGNRGGAEYRGVAPEYASFNTGTQCRWRVVDKEPYSEGIAHHTAPVMGGGCEASLQALTGKLQASYSREIFMIWGGALGKPGSYAAEIKLMNH